MKKISKFQYYSPTPKGYECCKCGVKGVRLYRDYNTFLDQQTLRCRKCAIKHSKRSNPNIEKEVVGLEHSIGWLVAAVPTEDGSTFWGYTSVPEAGVLWWNSLPKESKKPLLKCKLSGPKAKGPFVKLKR